MKKSKGDPAKKFNSKDYLTSFPLIPLYGKRNEQEEERRCRENVFLTYVGDSIAIESIFSWYL